MRGRELRVMAQPELFGKTQMTPENETFEHTSAYFMRR